MAGDPIRGWLRHMHRRNLSTATIRRRRVVMRRMERWADEHERKATWFTTEDIEEWLDGLRISPQSRSHYIGDISSFYRWLQRTGMRSDDPTETIARPQRPRYLPHPIGDDDLARAMEAADPKLRAVLALASLAGLRVSEIASLDVNAINWQQQLIHVHQGKGRRDRIVPLHPVLETELRRYGLPKHGPIINHDGRAYAPGSVSSMVSRHFHDLGINSTCHSLRHWFASKAYGVGGDIRAVQELLGHSSLTTTQVYTALDPRAARVAVEGIAPAG